MKCLVVLVGATGVGKSDLSIELAKRFSAPIISSDSRQIYKQMRIGTAVPSEEQLSAVTHYFIQTHDATELYTAGSYGRDVLTLIDKLFLTNDTVMLVGGSGLYIDAVCDGMDDIPSSNLELRDLLNARVAAGELPIMLEELKQKDEIYYNEVDKSNAKRVIRALEVIIETGLPFSSFRSGDKKKRDFNIIKIGVNRPREELYQRINQRVDIMMEEGLLEEATSLYPLREHNALQTVGYREFFDYIDGKTTLDEAVELLKRNTRRYAKRQTTWFKRGGDISWFAPDGIERVVDFVGLRMAEDEFVISACADKSEDMLFDILGAVQLKYGFISQNASRKISSLLGVELRQIEDIITYNDAFNPQQAKYAISVCLGRLCKKHGGDKLVDVIESVLGVPMGGVSPDGCFSLSKRGCIGNCSTSPTLWIGDRKYDNLSVDVLKKVLDKL